MPLSSRHRRRTALLVTAATLLVTLLAIGCARYGADGVVRRVRAELNALRPHPDYVPTPLAIAPPPALPTQTGRPAAPTTLPRPLPAVTATPAPTAAPRHTPPQPAVALSGFTHMWQTWNNCGPATLAMQLSYFGSRLGQAEVGASLRPDADDKNVSPHEMVAFARGQGYLARLQVNGTQDQLRLFLSNGLPVIIETWHEPDPNDGMGHYRLLTGYDDAGQHWIAYDTYDAKNLVNPSGDYQGIRIPFTGMDELWRVFNRVYVLVYTPETAPLVESILGPSQDEQFMWQHSLTQAHFETQQDPADPFAWFNVGSSYVALGDYGQAAAAFDRARQHGLPWRMLWYQFGPFQAYYETGRFDEAIALGDATLRTVGNVEELHYWRGRALSAAGDVAAARRAFQRAVALNLHYQAAQDALAALAAP